jgi:hypothetical protein
MDIMIHNVRTKSLIKPLKLSMQLRNSAKNSRTGPGLRRDVHAHHGGLKEMGDGSLVQRYGHVCQV